VKSAALVIDKLRDNAFTNRLKWIKGVDVPFVEDFKLQAEACNFPIQSTAASMMKYAMVLVNQYIIDNNKTWEILLTVHDELCVEVDMATFKEDSAIIKGLMEKAGTEFLVGLKMDSEMVVSKYWTKNPDENLLKDGA
jgi:DNA polymerase I-like protein with 3'-5' exonuclease and polymerase domains